MTNRSYQSAKMAREISQNTLGTALTSLLIDVANELGLERSHSEVYDRSYGKDKGEWHHTIGKVGQKESTQWDHNGITPILDFYTSRQESGLKIRASYSQFRREVLESAIERTLERYDRAETEQNGKTDIELVWGWPEIKDKSTK